MYTYTTLEENREFAAEFDHRTSSILGLDIGPILKEFGVEDDPQTVQKTVARLHRVFSICRSKYRLDIEGAYCVTINALIHCLDAGDRPEATSIQHYRNATGQEI